MLKNIYNQRVTILNKLKRTDSLTGADVWYKTVIEDAAWYTKAARTASGSGVYIGTYITVLLPFHSDYKNYLDWVAENNREKYFTISANDYIVLGDVAEEITADNVVKTLQKYGENVCTVRSHSTQYQRYGAKVQVRIEGV